MFRERRQERREERRGGNGATHYRMRQKLVSIGDDYWIEDDQGERVYKADGKALRARKRPAPAGGRAVASARIGMFAPH